MVVFDIHVITTFVSPFTSDVPSESLGDFYYAMRTNILPELPGRSKRGNSFPLLGLVWAKRHDLNSIKLF